MYRSGNIQYLRNLHKIMVYLHNFVADSRDFMFPLSKSVLLMVLNMVHVKDDLAVTGSPISLY